MSADAYWHILYVTDSGASEWVWNAREGEAPPSILLRNGERGERRDRLRAQVAPDRHYIPEVGERIFIDLHPERAAEIATRKVDQFWGDRQFPLSQVYRSKRDAIEELFTRFYGDGHQPDLVVVDELLRERFLGART